MNENIVGNRNRGEFYECITVHDSNDTVFVERQLMARTNFTNAFLSFSITRGIEEQAVFPEMQLVTYEGYFSVFGNYQFRDIIYHRAINGDNPYYIKCRFSTLCYL